MCALGWWWSSYEVRYSAGTSLKYWMFSWLYQSTFAMFNVLFTLNLGTYADLTATWFLFLNVATATNQLPLQLQQPFYSVGYGLPLYNAFNGARYILFNAYSPVYVNIGILLGWFFGLAVFCSYIDIGVMKKQQEMERQRIAALASKRSSILRPSILAT